MFDLKQATETTEIKSPVFSKLVAIPENSKCAGQVNH